MHFEMQKMGQWFNTKIFRAKAQICREKALRNKSTAKFLNVLCVFAHLREKFLV